MGGGEYISGDTRLPPVVDVRGAAATDGREMVWEGKLVSAAIAAGDAASYALERVYRTNNADLLALSAALRTEN